jgi:PAS domain S-box-containing protein
MAVSRWTEIWTETTLAREVRDAIAERVVRWTLPPLSCIAIYTALTIYLTIGVTQPTRYVPSMVGCTAFLSVAWLWRERRWLRAAALLSISANAAILSAVLLHGPTAPAYWAGLLLMALVVPLFGMRWASASALLLAAGGGGWFLLHARGWTFELQPLPPIASYVQYIGYLAIGLIIVAGPHRLLIDAIADAERRRSEAEAARLAEAQAELAFHAIYDQSSLALVLLENDGRITQLNERAAVWFGAGAPSLAGKLLSAVTLWNHEQHAHLLDAVRAAARGEKTHHEMIVTGSDGARSVHQISVSPFHASHGGLGYVILEAVDVSDLIETRSQLAQARRLEALGKLSGAVAHDFNNMLAAISGGCELLRLASRSNQPHLVDENAALIQSSVARAADLTKKLLAFGRQDRFNTEPLDINQLVVSIAQLFERTLHKNITVAVTTQPGELYVQADAAALEHALLNLALNAQDAMPDGGRLTLTTRLGIANDARLGIALDDDLRASSEIVVISVADTGTGMSEDVCERAFEPFFTTKAVGKGTGLGLAAVHGTMRSHHGAIAVRSREGQGSVFELYFPQVKPADAPARTTSESSAGSRLNARVYLADDEPLVRNAVSAMLDSIGCQVRALASGEALIETLASGPLPDVIVTDLAMPGLDGSRLVQTLETSYPGLPLLLITGYSGEDISSAFSGRSEHRLLRKPFTRKDLHRVLSELLVSHARAAVSQSVQRSRTPRYQTRS